MEEGEGREKKRGKEIDPGGELLHLTYPKLRKKGLLSTRKKKLV